MKGLNNFEDVVVEATKRWEALSGGQIPWIRVGTALCGKSAGADEVIDALRAEIGHHNIEATVSEVGCFGMCYAEPLIDITTSDGTRLFYGNVTPQQVPAIVYSHLVRNTPVHDLVLGYIGTEQPEIPNIWDFPMMKHQIRVALRNAGNIDPYDIYQYIANRGYSSLYKAVTRLTPEQVIEEVKESELRGRGGAAFPTATKWTFLAKSPGSVKYVLCNCEEGDPGAFNDKGILESDPHSLIEGMLLAGYATGASHGYIFIRHGHEGPIERTWAAIISAQELGLIGANIFGSDFSFDIEVSLVGDSYVAGEETALMEAIEGKRAMPRYRPPFPAQVGLFGKPTNINNVKTLSYIPQIIENGGTWFSNIGQGRSKGTAILCLSGDLVHTGMVEIPFGYTLEEVIHNIAGGVPNGNKLKLIQTGGPLGGVLGADQLDISLDFEAMAQAGAILGSGGIIAADEKTCAVDLTRSILAFCQYESCGKCFPCRLGMTHILEILEKICSFQGEMADLDVLHEVGQRMQSGSLCGHGQLGFNPVTSALKYFEYEFQSHIISKDCPTDQCTLNRYSPKTNRR